MVETLLVLAIGLLPPLLSFIFIRQAEARAQARLRAAMDAAARRQLQRLLLPADHHYIEGVGFIVGDIHCRYNARSAHVRCAVNPFGPCEACPHYESIASLSSSLADPT